MIYSMIEWFKNLSWIGILNRYILQFLFIRLMYVKITLPDFTFGHPVDLSKSDSVTYTWWSFKYWVIPFSGYGCEYQYINDSNRMFNITKPRKLNKNDN